MSKSQEIMDLVDEVCRNSYKAKDGDVVYMSKALEARFELHTIAGNIQTTELALEYANNAMKVLIKQTDWISVKDSLPKIDQNVIVYYDFARNEPFVAFFNDEGHWEDDESRRYHNITHWKPLPEPPKGK